MASERNLAIVNSIKKSDLNSYKALRDLLDMAKVIADEEGDNDIAYALKLTDFIKRKVPTLPVSVGMNDLYWEALKFEAPHRFESFLLYMEKNRSPKKRFYQPRAKTLKIVVDDLQDLEDGVIEFYGLSLPPRVGKSTVCIFFLAWCAGRHPDLHNAMGGHSGILAKGFFKEFLNLITSPEYTYCEIFPNVTLESKSSDEYTVNLNSPDRFATLTCRGIDGTWTGAVDVSWDGILYVDDLVRDREHSLRKISLCYFFPCP